ncbi:hypothetical protein DPMN_062583 [Dreissena polymorpha]|uniref:Uncharacterized protein n=1 Tax=Dreissena polymorpha TaxID=45954 RepID=A0A9D4C9V7_DREPO|nr:hypothetical protein DPMN_062583 [Dreissena polymorpha]
MTCLYVKCRSNNHYDFARQKSQQSSYNISSCGFFKGSDWRRAMRYSLKHATDFIYLEKKTKN